MARKKANAESETKKGKTEATPAADVPKRESKGRVEVPIVPVALLERHASLPEREVILAAFADDYPRVLARAVELAAALAAPAPSATQKKARAAAEPPTLPSARPVERPHTPAQIPLPELALDRPADPAPAIQATPEEVRAPEAVPTEDPFATFTEEDHEDADAFFASLRTERAEPEVTEFDLPVTPSAEPREEGGATVMIAAMPDESEAHPAEEDRTTMISAMADDEPAPNEDRTTMIQAVVDEDDASPAEAEGAELTAPEAKTRRSRKATKRKRG
jgi:hypothetical protein